MPGEGNGTPLQYSCLENPMDGEAWWLHTVNMIAKGQTLLSDHTFTFIQQIFAALFDNPGSGVRRWVPGLCNTTSRSPWTQGVSGTSDLCSLSSALSSLRRGTEFGRLSALPPSHLWDEFLANLRTTPAPWPSPTAVDWLKETTWPRNGPSMRKYWLLELRWWLRR